MEREFKTSGGYVWLGKLPDELKYDSAEVLESSVKAQKSFPAETRQVALKLHFLGWNGSFGALGATYTPDKTARLRVQVAQSDNTDLAVSGPGLSKELATSVLDEATAALKETRLLGSGVLRFDHALMHPVDSTVAIFRVLTRSIVLLLGSNLETVSEEEIGTLIKMCREEYSTRSRKSAETPLIRNQ